MLDGINRIDAENRALQEELTELQFKRHAADRDRHNTAVVLLIEYLRLRLNSRGLYPDAEKTIKSALENEEILALMDKITSGAITDKDKLSGLVEAAYEESDKTATKDEQRTENKESDQFEELLAGNRKMIANEKTLLAANVSDRMDATVALFTLLLRLKTNCTWPFLEANERCKTALQNDGLLGLLGQIESGEVVDKTKLKELAVAIFTESDKKVLGEVPEVAGAAAAR